MLTFWRVFNHQWVLNFFKSFFCIYWDDHMVFILQFFNMIHHIDWFVYTEESLHPWDKSHLIMHGMWSSWWVGFSLMVKNWEFLRLCSSVILAYNFFCMISSCCLVSGQWWPQRMNLRVFLPLQFLGRISEG